MSDNELRMDHVDEDDGTEASVNVDSNGEYFDPSAADLPEPTGKTLDQDIDLPDSPSLELGEVAAIAGPPARRPDQDVEMFDIDDSELGGVAQDEQAIDNQASGSQPSAEDMVIDCQPQTQSKLPDPVKNLSKQVSRHRKAHNQAVLVKPRASLAPHRYWIAVRHAKRHPTDPEKQYTWFKGNRLTTLQTVDRMYRQQSWTDECLLVLGTLKTFPEDRMEELDLFNDKVVVLSCIKKSDAHSRVVDMTKGLIPEAFLAEASGRCQAQS